MLSKGRFFNGAKAGKPKNSFDRSIRSVAAANDGNLRVPYHSGGSIGPYADTGLAGKQVSASTISTRE
jgi:hypothetical protein